MIDTKYTTEQFLSALFPPKSLIELRAIEQPTNVLRKGKPEKVATNHSGYYDDHAALIADAALLSECEDIAGVFFTLNFLNPDLLTERNEARRSRGLDRRPINRYKQAGRGDTTSDGDTAGRNVILIDIDPVRPAFAPPRPKRPVHGK